MGTRVYIWKLLYLTIAHLLINMLLLQCCCLIVVIMMMEVSCHIVIRDWLDVHLIPMQVNM